VSALLAPSESARVTLAHFGEERQPLLVIDGCLADPEALRKAAAGGTFTPIGPYYPGLRAPVSREEVDALIEPLAEPLREIFDLPAPACFAEAFLSLVTVPGEALQPIQRLPHFDGVERERLALLLYLSPEGGGGTAFYRQRGTGFESVGADRFARFEAELRNGIAREGLPPPAYISGDTPLYEQVHAVEARFNRAIVYRGNTLHCAHLPPHFTPSMDPREGRLTLNLFLSTAPA
jgi:hypothetical protein